MRVERVVQILLAEQPERSRDFQAALRQHYAVHTAPDDARLLQLADQAREEGRPYDLILIAQDPPLLGSAQTLARLRVLAPTSILVPLLPPGSPPPSPAPGAPPPPYLPVPVDPETGLALVRDLLADRLAALTRTRADLIRPLAGLGEALLRQPDFDRALQRLYQQLDDLIGAEYLYVALYDRRRGRLLFLLTFDHGMYVAGQSRDFGLDQGLADWVIAHDAPLVSADFPAEAPERGWPPGDPDAPFLPASVMVLPLRLGGQVIGAVSAQSARLGAFREADAILFGFVADLLAGAVAHWWTDLLWRRQSDLLAEFDRTLTSGADRATILKQTADMVQRITGMESAAVVGATRRGARPLYAVPQDSAADRMREALATLTDRLALTDRRSGVDYSAVSTVLANLGERGVGRVVSHAIRTGGEIEAMLWLLHPTERPFDAHDQDGLAAAAARGRLALEHEALLTGQRRERQVFARIAWRCAVETDLALLLSSALHEAQKLAPWQGAAVWMPDPVSGGLQPIWQEGHRAAIPERRLPAGHPLFVAAGERDRVVILEGDDGAGGLPRGPAVAVSLRQSGAQSAGLLVLERGPDGGGFTPLELALLPPLGQVLAAGMEKVRWYSLADLHRRLAGALDQVDAEGWDAVTALLAGLLPGGVALLLHQDGDWRALGASHGSEPAAPVPWEGAGRPLLAALRPDATPVLYDTPALAGRGLAGIGILALAPVSAGGSIFGALALWSSRAGAVGAHELQMLSHAAQHLAPALAGGMPGGGRAHDRRVLGLVEAFGREVDNAADTAGVLHSLLLHALSSTPATAGAILLREAGDRLVMRADYPQGMGASLPEEVRRLAAEAIRQGQAQTLADANGTVACLPIVTTPAAGPAPAPVGALVVGSGQPNAFRPADFDLLSHLTAAAAGEIAGQAARDVERALRGVAGLPVPSSQVLARVPALVCQALGVPVCLINVLDRRRNRFVLAGNAGLPELANAQAALGLAGDDPHLAALFAAPPERLGRADGPGAQLWPRAVLRALGLQFGLAVPFWVDGRPFGVLSVHTYGERRFLPAAVRALAALAAELGAVLEGQQQERRLEALTALSHSLIAVGSEDYLPAAPAPDATMAAHLNRLLESTLELSDAGTAYLFLRRDTPPGITLQAAAGAARRQFTPPTERMLSYLLALSGPLYLSDTRPAPPADYPILDPATRSSLALPLRLDGPAAPGSPALGVILLESPTPLAVSQDDYRALQALATLTTALLVQGGMAQQLRGQTTQVRAISEALNTLLVEADEGLVQLRLLAGARMALSADLVMLYPWDGTGAPPETPPQSGNCQAGALAGSPAMQALVRQVVGAVASRGAVPYFVDDLIAQQGASLPEWALLEELQSLAVAPLVMGDTVVGVLFAGYRTRTHFDRPLRENISLFALLAATALHNVRTRARQAALLQEQIQSLSLAAHELREPVDKVHMIIETALNGLWLPMSDTLRERLSVAYKLLDEHYDLLGRVLELGRIQAGARPLARAPVVVGALAQAVVAAQAEFARERGVVLRAVVDPLLAPQPAALDEGLMRLALGNLVHNAVKFSREGSEVTLTCYVAYVEGRRQLVCEVEDAGVGIPAEAQELIFQPYYQVDHSLGRQQGGLGLGLPLARQIIGLHDGTLRVESVPDVGSRFTIRMPFLAA